MRKQVVFRFLILCVTISQGFASLSNNGSADSLEHLVRKKRVLDRTPNANTRVRFRDFFYVVNVKIEEVHNCAGIIMSSQVILTPATCVRYNIRYSVVAGTISTRGGGTLHTVNGILRHPQHEHDSIRYNVALLSIEPPITFGQNLNQPISIYNLNNGQLPPNTLVTVSGFGEIYRNPRFPCISPNIEGEREFTTSNELRAIQVPTNSIQACRAGYDNDHRIVNDEVICTHHPDKSCSPTELGNPLVYQGHLVGILIWNGINRGGSDVFVNVAFTPLRVWIMTHMFPDRIPRHHPPPRPERTSCSRVHPCNNK